MQGSILERYEKHIRRLEAGNFEDQTAAACIRAYVAELEKENPVTVFVNVSVPTAEVQQTTVSRLVERLSKLARVAPG